MLTMINGKACEYLLKHETIGSPTDSPFSEKAMFYKGALANLIQKIRVWRTTEPADVCEPRHDSTYSNQIC